MALIHATPKRWTIEEYKHLHELGVFGDERVELIEGEIVPMCPQGDPHRFGILHTTDVMVTALKDTHYVACQMNSDIPERSCPEPDFVVFPRPRALPDAPYSGEHLIIEVANTSLAYDRHEKASLYAKSGVPEYWILNVRDRQLEIHLRPQPDRKAIFKFSYKVVSIHRPDDIVSPGCRPDVRLRVADLL